jgi:Rad3-related DNA helicase
MLPKPKEIGAPEKFTKWRKYQDAAIVRALKSEARFVLHTIPTGGGKTLTYVAQHLLMGGRTCILTSTKALQNQIIRDYEELVSDIRGKNNYGCKEEPNNPLITVDLGPCNYNIDCSRISAGSGDKQCTYYAAFDKMVTSNLVVTNYSYYMHNLSKMGAFDLLVLDEAHSAPKELANFLGVSFRYEDLREFCGDTYPRTSKPEDWVAFAKTFVTIWGRKKLTYNKSAAGIHQASRLARLKRGMKTLSEHGDPDNWVPDATSKKKIMFDPLSPAKFAEDYLFAGVDKIYLVSATATRKTLNLLGIEKDEVEVCSFPHTFPVKNRRVSFLPSVRVSRNNTPSENSWWMNRMDLILKAHPHTKGIIHAVSYKRAELIHDLTKYPHRIITHTDARDKDYALDRFRKSSNGVFLSPSSTTGLDFPYDECRFQIIAKVPWPNLFSPIMKKRIELDKTYASYIAMQEIVQASGRATRAEDDFCETFIVDNNFWDWFIWANKRFAPKWFMNSLRKVATLPIRHTKASRRVE